MSAIRIVTIALCVFIVLDAVALCVLIGGRRLSVRRQARHGTAGELEAPEAPEAPAGDSADA